MRNEMGTATIAVEELKKYKALLDEGAITEEEFQRIKAEFLENDGKVNTQPVKAPAEKAKKDLKGELKKNPKILISAAAIVFVAIIVVVIAGNSPEAVAKSFVKANLIDMEKEASLCAYDYEEYLLSKYDSTEEFFSHASDFYGYSITSWREYYEAVNTMSEFYLGDYKIVAKVIDSEYISTEDLYAVCSERISEIEARTAFDFSQITKAKRVTVQLSYLDRYDVLEDQDDFPVYVVKYHGKWGWLYA